MLRRVTRTTLRWLRQRHRVPPRWTSLYGGSSDTVIGCFGGMDFIDKQEEFNITFGTDPVILPTVPTVPDNTATAKILLVLSDQCLLDMYLHTCRKIYVGTTGVDESTSMMEICREISELRKEWKDTNGRTIVDTLDGLFTKILALAGSLPECARDWPIQLYSTYYTALSSSISSRMMACKDYPTPSLVGLDTKQLQLEAYQHARVGASRHHKELVEEDARMEKKLKNMSRASGRNTQAYFAGVTKVTGTMDSLRRVRIIIFC